MPLCPSHALSCLFLSSGPQSWEVTGRDLRAETHTLLGEQMPRRGHSHSALTHLRSAAQKLKREMEALQSSSRGLLQSYWEEHRDCLSEIVQAIQTAQLHHEALLAAWPAEAGRLERSLRDVTERWQREQQERRRLQEALAELKGNIRVHCRIRPLLPFDEAQEPVSQNSSVSGGVVHAVDDETVLVECNRPGHPLINKTYTFERVYGPAESQRVVFEDVCPLLTSFLDGYNVCIMAYGQTGSGKSFTMLGPRCQEEPALPSEPRGDAGIIPRAAAELFRLLSEDASRSPEVGVSIAEVYNNGIVDLLANDSCRVASGVKRQVLPTQQGKKAVRGLTYRPVRSAAQFLTLVGGGLQLRAKQPTAVHAESSRSHLVVTVTLATVASPRRPSGPPSTPAPQSDWSASTEPCQPAPRSPATGRRQSPPVPLRTRAHGLGRVAPDPLGQVCATLQLVDLAGSECAGVSGVTGPALRETSCINRSLAALSDVLGALAEGRGHIPYRNSRLTHLLQDALGGDAKLQVIVCVSPGQRHVAETLQSLGFGARARQVERSRPAARKLR
ncbi:kinesin-like protein KIF25 isoform X2 [Moschus berezovskii]|uniref:kinesin-like protein KIF25 isoform X2 n=1 Tax=Moschus berezovskii TaxID=68408 RepID=UPI002443D0F0|nr:kinesin-like protein KIF25 isoform X2 [Moschus berezovskii]